MKTLSFSKLYSHPDKALERHLINSAKIALENLKEGHVRAFDTYDKAILEKVILTSCLCHDIGKSTKYFQQYLFASEDEKNKLKNMDETRHGLLSAISCFYAVEKQLEDEQISGDQRAFLSFIAFLIVRRHHGNLGDVVDETVISKKNEEILSNQIKSIDTEKLSILNEHLQRNGLKQDISKDLLTKWTSIIKKDLRKIKRKLRHLDKQKNLNFYLMTNYLFSLLIDADKSEVVVGENIERRKISLDSLVVDNYKTSLEFKRSKMNFLREQAYQEVLKNEVNLNDRVFSINLPTGLGKTFTSFSFALNLREKIRKEKNFTPRIIYSLPFLSIIEQNAEKIEEILEYNGVKVDTSILLKHHHLSEVYYKKDDDEFEQDQAKILIEGWNSEIVITTFVQLFHTLISNKNKSLRKFHRLSGSIIILDEVQSIPFKYWLLVKGIFEKATQELDCYIVFVTATEPLIFERNEVLPLIDRTSYFAAMDRVTIKPQLEKDMTIDEFVDSVNIEEDKSYLFIFNTIKSVKAFYNQLKKKVNDEVAFLSTHVTPFERLERINKMRKGKIRFAVATQLVEAGVDIDFDVVYRDIAPLDSINQAAGRCNRNWDGEGSKGEVIVISLKDEKRLYSDYIYDRVLIDITRNILNQKQEIPEKDFLDIVEIYYREVKDKKSSDTSRELIQAVYKMKYDSVDETTCIRDFRLISQDYPKLDVFIEINDDAKIVWGKYVKIKEIKNLFKRRLAFSEIKADFYNFTVSIPATVDNLPPEVAGFRYVNNNSLDEYYDETTGFKCEGVTAIW